ncbi:MAG: guanylate kinase [Nitrospirota bacterium]|nr:guanylate kinase [Nitrospirota bacterium]
MERRGVLFVVSAPSGAGKTTLCKELAARVPSLKHSISYTTRSPRPGEVHGREYFFVDDRYFQSLVERNEFAEWAQVYGQRYGTPRATLIEMMDKGIDVLLEIDVQGARQIKKTFEDAVYVYIFPPSIDALRLRLEQRGGDSTEEIQRRLQKVREEMWSYREYDYIVKNDDMTKAIKALEAIVLAERIRTKRVDVHWLEENFIREKELHSRSADDQSE